MKFFMARILAFSFVLQLCLPVTYAQNSTTLFGSIRDWFSANLPQTHTNSIAVETTFQSITLTSSDNWDSVASQAVSEVDYVYDSDSNTLEIYSALGFAYFSSSANGTPSASLDSDVKLMSDIDLQGALWTPIAYANTRSYSGTFEGNGHTISGLNVDNSNNYFTDSGRFGLFGRSTGTIQNFQLEGTVITRGGISAPLSGAVVAENMGKIQDVQVLATLSIAESSTTQTKVGGIAGSNTGEILNCTVLEDSSLTSFAYVGGIAATNSGTISGCTSYADLQLSTPYTAVYMGGICAYNSGGTIVNSQNMGDLSFDMGTSTISTYIGGIVGQTSGTSVLKNASNSGNISITFAYTPSLRIGGIAGELSSSSTAENCYHSGVYTQNGTSSSALVGTLVGRNYGAISYCYWLYDEDLPVVGSNNAPTNHSYFLDDSGTLYNPSTATTYTMYEQQPTLLRALNAWIFGEGDTALQYWWEDTQVQNNHYPVLGQAYSTETMCGCGELHSNVNGYWWGIVGDDSGRLYIDFDNNCQADSGDILVTSSALNAGNYYLADDIAMSTLAIQDDLNLCLNSHTLSASLACADSTFQLWGKGTVTGGVTLQNSIFHLLTATIQSATTPLTIDQNSSATIHGGTITANSGVDLVVNKGSLSLSGGTLTGGNHGVVVDSGATVTMTNGAISGTASHAVLLTGGDFTISGGTLSPSDGYGVSYQSGDLYLAGQPSLPSVLLGADQTITLTESLDLPSAVEIVPVLSPDIDAPLTIATGDGTYTPTSQDSDAFSPVKITHAVAFNQTDCTVDLVISPYEIHAVWSELSQVYTGEPLVPEVYVHGFDPTDDVTLDLSPTGYTDVGSYEVTSSLTGAQSEHYFLSDLTKSRTFTITKQPVTVTLNRNYNVVSHTASPDVAVWLSYHSLEGETLDLVPSEVGTYRLTATLVDNSNHYLVGALGDTLDLGLFVVGNQSPATYTTSFSDSTPQTAEMIADTIHILPKSTDQQDGKTFVGWRYLDALYTAGSRFAQPTANVLLVAEWETQSTLSGRVLSQTNTPISGATVTLQQGATILATTTTDPSGGYQFTAVPGSYLVTAQISDQSATLGVVVQETSTTASDILLFSYQVDVSVAAGLPVLSVGNLDLLAQQLQQSSALKRLEFLVAPAPTVDSIVSLADHIAFFVDISLTQTTNTATTSVTDTGSVLLPITFSIPAEAQNKSNYVAYRLHDDGISEEIHTITSTPNANGEYIIVNSDTTSVTLYVCKFSIFAVGYSIPTTPNNNSSSGGSVPMDFNLKVTPPANGSVITSHASAKTGETITLTLTPQTGYALDTINLFCRSYEKIELAYLGDGVYTFIMPSGDLTISALFIPLQSTEIFVDISPEDWYYDAVVWAQHQSITSGTGDGTTFGPNAIVTRAEATTLLWNAMEQPQPLDLNPFFDLYQEDWYYHSVLWALNRGITVGTSKNTFSPHDPCNRAQMLTFLYAMAGSPAVTGQSPFEDVTQSDWYYQPVLWGVANGLTDGVTPTNFGANNPCTRAEIVTFLYRYLQQ